MSLLRTKRSWLQAQFAEGDTAADRKRKPSQQGSLASTKPARGKKPKLAKVGQSRAKSRTNPKASAAARQMTPKSERAKRLLWWKAKQSEECLLWSDREHDRCHPTPEEDCVRCRFKQLGPAWRCKQGSLCLIGQCSESTFNQARVTDW